MPTSTDSRPRNLAAVSITIVTVIAIGGFVFLAFGGRERNADLLGEPKSLATSNSKSEKTIVGSGWSTDVDASTAVTNAIELATSNLDVPPDIAIIYDGMGKDLESVLKSARQTLGPTTKIFGSMSGSKMSLNDQCVSASQENESASRTRGLSVLTIKSSEIKFGVGSSHFDDDTSIRPATKTALQKGMASAGLGDGELPSAILLSPKFGNEEEIIAGIEEVVGTDTPILGGSMFGSFCGDAEGSDEVVKNGVSLTVIKTDLPIGWKYEAGFEILDPVSAVITKLDGRTIVELDGRPAFDVYDEWFEGKVSELCARGDADAIRNLRNLNPLCKTITSPDKQTYYNFTIVSPNPEEKTIGARIELKEGDRIFLSRGSWETLMNRICYLPKVAKANAETDSKMDVLFGIGFFCGGVVELIPESEIKKIPPLVRNANNGAPFIACVTAGEQGHFPGIGGIHGHLSTSFLVIGTDSK